MNSNPYKNLPPLERRLGGVIPEERVTDEYGRIYLYYPICDAARLLRCGRQKAVNPSFLITFPYTSYFYIQTEKTLTIFVNAL